MIPKALNKGKPLLGRFGGFPGLNFRILKLLGLTRTPLSSLRFISFVQILLGHIVDVLRHSDGLLKVSLGYVPTGTEQAQVPRQEQRRQRPQRSRRATYCG